MSVGQFLSVKERNIVRITIDKKKRYRENRKSKWIDIIIYHMKPIMLVFHQVEHTFKKQI
jgi:hypothetical protein